MTRKIRHGGKLRLILLLLCVVVLAQSSALSAQSRLHQSTDHCCLLCHTGPLPFLQTSTSAALAPDFQVVWQSPPAPFETISDIQVIPSPSRAPPAS